MSTIYRSIVVGVDFSPSSEAALSVAADLARRSKARLSVVHFVHAEIAEEHETSWRDGLEQLIHLAEVELGRLVERVLPDRADLDLVSTTRLGHRFVELIRTVESEEADLLVLGGHGDSHRYRQNPGLLGMKCIRKAPCEVMLVPGESSPPFKRILVGIDYSDRSAAALKEALEIGQLTGAKVHVVHMSLPPWLYLMNAGLKDVVVPERARRAYLRHQESEMERFLKGLATESDFEFSTLERRDPAEGLMECQESLEADLVVVGNRGQTGSELAQLGSFAECIVHRSSECAVLTVKDGCGRSSVEAVRKQVA